MIILLQLYKGTIICKRERAQIAGSKILAARKKHKAKEEQATTRVIVSEGSVSCIGELQNARKLFDDIKAMDLLKSST